MTDPMTKRITKIGRMIICFAEADLNGLAEGECRDLVKRWCVVGAELFGKGIYRLKPTLVSWF